MMATKHEDKLMVAEQILEVRYTPSGSFLDVRGYVADYIRENGFLPHWKIDINVVSFRDKPEKAEKEGAFAGYRNAGYFVYDPQTRNFFVDRSGSFWRTLMKNEHYKIPDIERFGARTKVFLPSEKSFEDINKHVFETLYTDMTRKVLGGTQTDVQFVVDLKEDDFDVRVSGGPIHEKEVGKYLSFDSKHFEKTGLFIDLDYNKAKNVKHDDVTKLLRAAVELTWAKVERIAAAIGV
jgi:hypothetical protein